MLRKFSALVTVTLICTLMIAACQTATATPEPTATPPPSPPKVSARDLTQEHLLKWAEWFAWELTLPPNGPMLVMTYGFADSQYSCEREFSEDEAHRARAQESRFRQLPYKHSWKGSSWGLQKTDFWQTLSDPDITTPDLELVQDIVADFVWQYRDSVFSMAYLYDLRGCPHSLDILGALLYPHYDELPVH